MNALEKNQRLWSVVLSVGIIIGLIWLLIGVFVLLLTSISTPTPVDAFYEEFPSIIAEGKIIEFTYTDDNSNEDFIIRSDKKVYTPLWVWNGFDVYVMVENKSGRDQLTFSQLFFSKDFTIEKVFILDPGATTIIKEPIYKEVCIPNDFCYNKKIGEQDKIVDGKWNPIDQYPFSEKDYQVFISEYSIPVKEKIGQAKQKFLSPIINDKIVYYKIRLKANEHFVETEFDIEVMGDSGGYGLLDPTIFTENFNTYNDGDLDGQGDWVFAGGQHFQVQGTTVKEGSKAIIEATEEATADATKEGAQISAGNIGSYIQRSTIDGESLFYIFEDTSVVAGIRLRTSGEIYKYSNAGSEKIADYIANTWYWVEIEWNEEGSGSTPQIRFKVDNGEWTNWETPLNNWTTGVNKVLLGHDSRGGFSGDSYFDYIAENPIGEEPATEIFDDDFESYNLGNLYGQGGWLKDYTYGASVVNNPTAEGIRAVKVSENTGFLNATRKIGSPVGIGTIYFYAYFLPYAQGYFFLADDTDYPLHLRFNSGETEIIIDFKDGCSEDNSVGVVPVNEWIMLGIDWDKTTGKSRLLIDDTWSSYYTCEALNMDLDRIVLYGESDGDANWYLDFIHSEGTILDLVSVWGINPESGTEITDLDSIFEFGWKGLTNYDALYITFRHPQTGILTNAKQYDISEIGGNGELEINLQDFNIEKNANWYLHAVATYEGYQYEGEYFLSGYGWNWTDDLTDKTYYLNINIEGFEEIFIVSDFEDWYGENAKFDEPTAMFSAIAGVFDPIFSVIGEFGNRIVDYFNVNESYAQGYEIGRTISYFRYFVDQISMLLGGFPILLWLFIIILLLTGIFIFRLILKFIPFLG